MKSITYIGGCATISEFGQKFTLARRSVTVSDEVGKAFMNHPTYRVVDIPDIVNATDVNANAGQDGSGDGQNGANNENVDPNAQNNENVDPNAQNNELDGQPGEDVDPNAQNDENVDLDTRESTKKKLMRQTAEQLQEMCTKAGLDADGSKEVLADRLLDSEV